MEWSDPRLASASSQQWVRVAGADGGLSGQRWFRVSARLSLGCSLDKDRKADPVESGPWTARAQSEENAGERRLEAPEPWRPAPRSPVEPAHSPSSEELAATTCQSFTANLGQRSYFHKSQFQDLLCDWGHLELKKIIQSGRRES